MKTRLIPFLILMLCACSADKQLSSQNNIAEQLGTPVERTDQPGTTDKQAVFQNIQRIKIATVGARDLQVTSALYQQWLDYQLIEEGFIPAQLAESWGANAMSARPYALLQSQSGDDVFLRVVEVGFPEGYKAMTTHGWNAIELIVKDPDAVYEKLMDSPFQHIGGPANLGNTSIRATQFKGLSEEVFYFTADLGDSNQSSLLKARTAIDRPFIMVVAGPDARQLVDFYTWELGAEESFFIEMPISTVSSAQGMPSDHPYPLGFVRLAEFSHSIEMDGYPDMTTPRPTFKGELPPGVSITSFSVKNLDLIDPDLFVSVPITASGVAYQGNRTATIIGPAGELIELIEEKH